MPNKFEAALNFERELFLNGLTDIVRDPLISQLENDKPIATLTRDQQAFRSAYVSNCCSDFMLEDRPYWAMGGQYLICQPIPCYMFCCKDDSEEKAAISRRLILTERSLVYELDAGGVNEPN